MKKLYTQQDKDNIRTTYSKESGLPLYIHPSINDRTLVRFPAIRKKLLDMYVKNFDFSKFEYLKARTKSTVRCKVHDHEFLIPPEQLSQKLSGCPVCSKEKMAATQSSNTENFIEKSISLHGGRYDYTETVYVKALEKVKVRCPIHGSWPVLPNTHLDKKGIGCPRCGKLRQGFTRERYDGAPATFYCVSLPNGLFKLGITSKLDVYKRYPPRDHRLLLGIPVYITFLDGKIAWDIEQAALKLLGTSLYDGKRVLSKTGNTEIVATNPVTIINKAIKDYNYG